MADLLQLLIGGLSTGAIYARSGRFIVKLLAVWIAKRFQRPLFDGERPQVDAA